MNPTDRAAAATEPLQIGQRSIERGERVRLDLPVASQSSGVELTMPVRVLRGRKAGPTLFVSAALHGDEIVGVEIIRRLLRLGLLRRLRGTLIAVPVVNVFGFNAHTRYLPDRRDLNRSFPGSEGGSLAARLAHFFLEEIVNRSDYGIDLHTAAIHRTNLPQVRIAPEDPDATSSINPSVRELAEAFGAPVVMQTQGPAGSLRHAAAERGIGMLLYEAGEALRFNEWAIRAGVRGVLGVMRKLEMLPQDKRRAPRARSLEAQRSTWVRATESGVLMARRGLGDVVRKGQKLAVIGPPLGDEEYEVIAPGDGLIIGRTNLPLVHEGDALYHIALLDTDKAAERTMERFTKEYGGLEDPNLADEPDRDSEEDEG